MNVPDAHNPNFPWRVDKGSTIVDATGMPVAQGLYYTSVLRGKPAASGTVYNRSDYAGPIRARLICEAVNEAARQAGMITPQRNQHNDT